METRLDTHFYLPFFQNISHIIKEKPYYRLEEIVEFSNDTTDFSEFDGEYFEYLEISGILLGLNQYKTTKTEIKKAPSRAKKKTRAGDIVVSLTRPHRGAIAIINDSEIIASTGFSVIREIKPIINKNWLLYTLLCKICLQQMLQRSSGGNYPA
ncbi:MAG: hypothetical protein IJ157_02500 [Clostridia bacterium]|nr:hypothetical protein [Clostridia bacterium]